MSNAVIPSHDVARIHNHRPVHLERLPCSFDHHINPTVVVYLGGSVFSHGGSVGLAEILSFALLAVLLREYGLDFDPSRLWLRQAAFDFRDFNIPPIGRSAAPSHHVARPGFSSPP